MPAKGAVAQLLGNERDYFAREFGVQWYDP